MTNRKPRLCVLTPNALEAKLFVRALEEDFEVTTFESIGDELMKAIPGCDLLLMREGDSRNHRLEFLRRALKLKPDLKVLVIEGGESMGMLVYLETGAAGFVERGASVTTMIDQIRSAGRGEILLSGQAGGELLRRVQELAVLLVDREVDLSRCRDLTDREREVAVLLDRRRSNEDIAEELGIALGTAKTHVHNILRKLDVESRSLAGLYWRIFSQAAEKAVQGPPSGHS